MIGALYGKKVHLVKGFAWALRFLGLFKNSVNKAFGNLSYEQGMSEYKADYRLTSLEESIIKTQSKD